MAGEEMETVREPDIDLLNAHRHRICTYFADHDDWVADQKDRILRAFHPDAEAVKVTHGDHGVPHAFCISEFPLCHRDELLTFLLQTTERIWRNNVASG